MSTDHRTRPAIDWATDDELNRLSLDPELCKHLFGQSSLLVELIKRMQGCAEDSFWYRPARVVADGEWAAAGGFKGAPQSRTVEIGYRVHPDFRRRGLASALVRWLCQAAAEQGVEQMVAVTMNNNLGSQSVLARNGFVHTGDLLSDSRYWLQRWRYRTPEHLVRKYSGPATASGARPDGRLPG